MPAWATIVTTLITSIASVVVAFFGVKAQQRDKESKRNEELKKEAEEKEREAKAKAEKERSDKLDTLLKRVDDLAEEVEKLNEENRKENEKISALFELSNANFNYSQSMSQVISAIGNSLVHSGSLEDASTAEIHDAIAKHQDRESKILNQIYKISY